MRLRAGSLPTLASLSAAALAFLTLGQAGPARSPHARVYTEHAVAADHPLASAAGLEILEAGGNAADAAVATALALGVVSPASSGLGGGGFALYYRASDRSITFLDFREIAPAAATPDLFAARPGDDPSTTAERSMYGGLAVAVPGEPAGLDALWSRFGSGRVARSQIAAPAERLAREGFAASQYVSEWSANGAARLRRDPLLGSWFPRGRDRIPVGTILRNPALAATLRTFGRQGARPFYRGEVARAIVTAVRAHGGVMTLEDLERYAVRERAPFEAVRFGRRWVTAPPPSAGGLALLESLALLEHWQPEEGYREGAAFRHALAESWIGAYADRAAYLGDPDHVEIPIDRLRAEARVAARAQIFDPHRHRPIEDWELPLPGSPSDPAAAATTAVRGGGTSHLCVVDREGNVAALTTTVNLTFGAQFTAAGMVMNDEMDDFARALGAVNAFGLPGGAPNLVGPGRRPVSSMTPTIVFEEDRPVLCIGGAGGSRIPTAVEQVALFHFLFGDPTGEAMLRRRVHQQGRPPVLVFERGLDPTIAAGLWRRGHDLAAVENVGTVQAIAIVHTERGRELHAASDPRKGGEPRGR
jgi:gamma-glutamyltranspeptidase/glutathione hydrolase